MVLDMCRNTKRMVLDFLVVPSDKTRSSGHKVNHKMLHLNMRKNFLTLRVAEHCSRVLKEVVEFPCLETSKPLLDAFLCYLPWQAGWTG